MNPRQLRARVVHAEAHRLGVDLADLLAAGHLTADPAAVLAKPRRTRSRRRALDDREVAELADAVRLTSRTSRDPVLDLLLVRFHLETGARRQGALNLRHRDLDTRRCTVWLREKHGDQREQPVSPSLLAAAGARRPGVCRQKR